MSNITIVGAGMAGLLAANMLHRNNITIVEAQSSLPNNHSAVLRFKSDKVAEVLGIPFKQVNMLKGVLPYSHPVVDALLYSKKAGGIARSDRSIIGGTVSDTRWIAPPNLIELMSRGRHANIILNFSFDLLRSDPRHFIDGPVISTMPMPVLMEILDYVPATGRPEFKSIHGVNVTATLCDVDAYVSLYIPDPDMAFNRISITGDQLIMEYSFPNVPELTTAKKVIEISVQQEVMKACEIFGGLSFVADSIKVAPQRYSKVLPIDERERKAFLAWATDKYNIFSLGRFATWRPGLLLDDLVHDVRLIEKWIGDRYDMRFAR